MITDFIRIGHAPEDNLSTKRLKSLSAGCVFVVICVTLAFFLEPDRSPIYRTLDVAALATQLAGLIALHLTRKAENLFYFYVPAYMVVDLGFMLLNGNREGDILPFLVIPSVAVVILGPKKSRPWFVACFLVMLIVPIIDGYLPEISLTLNQTLINPTGSLFHSPLKRPLEISEGLTMTVGYIVYLFPDLFWLSPT